MAYKWRLNGYEMEYLSKPKPNHYDTITILRSEEKQEHEMNQNYPSPKLIF